jgi:hypothetical protein
MAAVITSLIKNTNHASMAMANQTVTLSQFIGIGMLEQGEVQQH